MAIIICKNCGNEFEGNYCNNCGQKSKTARLDWHYLNDEAKYTFLHLNGGLLFTIAQLFKRPGHAIREFVDGKRVNYYKPVLLLFVLAGFYGLLMHNIDFRKTQEVMNATSVMNEQQIAINELMFKGMEWWISHYSLMEILLLPIYSGITWLAFRGWGYNYVEHIILNVFSASQRLLITIAFFPLTWFYQGTMTGVILANLVAVVIFCVGIWTMIQFFKGKELGMFILRYLLFLFLCITAIVLVIVPGAIYFFATHKELFRH
ncbi:DUF3667 domain-containing protein [Flavobacterium silvaticum]|uniref:DUF3667 domain-containing protein n=1 Tax=Flavobacterium silvaticum TaxID=1852020 RepID=A0A972FRL0_9FLAO|nr:DUF3667 domain-containing protein [Flavobacterium silvaticum]NMH28084.1 DUF3667 domain-containing protein [Flavobacterium silvaticum]